MGIGLGASGLRDLAGLRDRADLRDRVEMTGARLVRLQIALRVPGGMTGVRRGRLGIGHRASLGIGRGGIAHLGLGIGRRGLVEMIVRADLSRVGTGRRAGTGLRGVVRQEAGPRVVIRGQGGLRAESLRVLFGSGRS